MPGDTMSMRELAGLMEEAGRDDEAEPALREAVDDGNEFAALALSELLRGTERADQADTVLQEFRPSRPVPREV
ncbi:hypothetical protein ITP53_08865 [Nonomuraea sp. K274]|uniref:Tetratricopeptide repeat protein n=1 Tax=Nonomuraea cypriaca TaxID=1187855 RepID=A0A931A449_9ACTN|nr:hypothetical protein [Nonomuraea cypriaca]MBF8185851.1 hypothetical protein [Nonomuraea cypriaca]